MEFFEIADRRYARFPRLSRLPGVSHAFSTRPHDVSARRDDLAPIRAARRATMAGDLGFVSARLAHCVQVHQPGVAVIHEGSTGAFEATDGLCTNVRGTPLMVFSADCPLVVVVDPQSAALGVAHSSWRCTVAGIVPVLVERLRAEFGADPRRMHAGIGPSAGPQQYEVGSDVYDAAKTLPQRERHFVRQDGRMYFDLWSANRAQLLESSVPEENIEIAGICTMTATDVFYSFRREGAGCGHFGLMAGLSG